MNFLNNVQESFNKEILKNSNFRHFSHCAETEILFTVKILKLDFNINVNLSNILYRHDTAYIKKLHLKK